MLLIETAPRKAKNSAWNAGYIGARIGAKMTALYAAIFLVYAFMRCTIMLLSLPSPDAGTAGTILATTSSLLIATITITLLALAVSMVAGAVTSLMIYWFKQRYKWQIVALEHSLIGFAVAVVMVLLMQLVLLPLAGLYPYSLPAATYIFWFGLPALLYVGVIGIKEWRKREHVALDIHSTIRDKRP